ncbi:MAG: serine/threonine-protein kinase [Myxococcales bacterium]|nr:serine/threonine-protein kinase [Myxococcales bacterium]
MTAAEDIQLVCVAGRYDVLAPLGRGGMGEAHRVRDRTSGQELALKRLRDAGRRGTVVELFEREFHTLTQLAHPRIVRAFDYGFDEQADGDHAYYTMELLDGGDLRELAPLPWQEVCTIAYDVCSALSLLHSRRLVHRDLTPRNVRRTADGAAKLIDFGLLDTFGPSNIVAGTPPYVAPELMNKVSLDARSDLFSLGATLYFALTGRVAFQVARFEQLRDVWRGTPRSPRKLVPEIPEALDQLVMSLLRIDMGSRPRSAAEVMDRVAPMLTHPPDESLSVAGAYLTAPRHVGREHMVTRMRKQVMRAVRGRGGGFLVVGDPGTGRSRALDTFVLEAKLMGAATARAGATDGAHGPLGVVQALVAQVHQAARPTSLAAAESDPRIWRLLFGESSGPDPALLDIGRPGHSRAETQELLGEWMLCVARRHLVALAIDDFELIDEPSAALIATLSMDAPRHRLAYGLSVRKESLQPPTPALSVLQEHAHEVDLEPLTEPQVRELLDGVFGDVPCLDGLSLQLHQLSRGRPRECMALAQHLVDTGVIGYRAGTFQLPATIDRSRLPADFDGTAEAQVAALPAPTRTLGQLLSLSAIERLTRAQLLQVAGLSAEQVDAGIENLRSMQAVAGSPQGYRMCHPAMAALLRRSIADEDLPTLHDQLAAAYGSAGEGTVAVSFHSLRGRHPEMALDALLEEESNQARASMYQGFRQIGIDATAETYAWALEVAETLGRPKREVSKLWPTLAAIAAIGGDARFYDMIAPRWLAELKRASGYCDWLELSDVDDPAARAAQAFACASRRYGGASEGDCILAPSDAIKGMVTYVVYSIAVSARTLRTELSAALPELLAPFCTLNPVVQAMYLNAEASAAGHFGLREETRERYIALVDAIDSLEGDGLAYMDKVRAACCQSIATQEAVLGVAKKDPGKWLHSDDPAQRVGAEYIRKIAALHRGDWDAAETHRREAEIIGLQHDVAAMFSTLAEEFETHALARDLTGLQRIRARMQESSARVPRWRPFVAMADAYCQYFCAAGEAAMEIIERLREQTHHEPHLHRLQPLMETLAVEILVHRGQAEEAMEVGRKALASCETLGQRHMARSLCLPVALAEAHLGHHRQAAERIRLVVAAQEALGVSGLLVGRSHEYLARCALIQGDRAGFHAAAEAAAKHYRPGDSEILGALHERLMEDGRQAGLVERTETSAAHGTPSATDELATQVSVTFMRCQNANERASAALTLLREAASTDTGCLFLLSEGVLTLSAAVGDAGPDAAKLHEFAQAQIDLEQDTEVCTITAELSEESSTELASILLEHDGRALHPIPLITAHANELLLAGIALLAEPESDQPLSPVAEAIAKHLIESGDCIPVAAG